MTGVIGVQRRDVEEAQVTTRRAAATAAIGRERSFAIGSQAWSVREVIDPTTRTPVLIFSAAGVARRVRNYPSNWRELSGEQLYAVSWSR